MNATLDKGSARFVASACPHDCPSTCALEVERLDAHTIGRVRGAADNSYTAGVICAKVARYAERVHHPGRLLRPLQRTGARGDGSYREISWEAALDEVAEAFQKAEAAHGAEAVWPYHYAGTMGLVQRKGIYRLAHAKGYSRFQETICVTISQAGYKAGCGRITGTDPREMAKSDLIVIWGTNAVHTQVNVMTHVARARKERGAKVVVIDPYRNATAEFGDTHLMLRPGTDGALAVGVMHVLFAEGYADWDYMRRYTDCPEALEAHLKDRPPEWAAEVTGLSVQEIVDFARLYGRTERSYLRLGYGFARQRNGAPNMHAAICLPAITGAWRHEGGGALYVNGDIYHFDMSLIEGHAMRDESIRALDQSRIGAVLTGDAEALHGGPPVTAMLIQNTNPMMVAPDLNVVHRGFMRDDLFTCVHEQFMTETAQVADIVLPATTFLEHDDIYKGGGHQHIMMGPKVIEPPGEARENHYVFRELAQRLGVGDRPGFAMSAWEMADETLKLSGYPGAAELTEMRWLDCQPGFEEAHFLNGFAHPDGRFHFAPDWAAIGPAHAVMPKLPDHLNIIDVATAEHPFRLVTAPARNFLNSSFTETPTSTKKERRPEVMVHPDDAERLGIAEGAPVSLGNARGEVALHATLFDGLQPGVLIVESIWPNSAFEGGIGINAVTGADAVPPNGGAAFHDTAVWLRPRN
ncbi:molybdopterin-dependent oxidoreductase [Marinibaculum pumilum]|uniref:Molybdopterin-dependent oxidoreductase n=1 Tax=Marinibaculum pumilum TaxID=1766165 RepID=A0ABV7KVT3_9PROT